MTIKTYLNQARTLDKQIDSKLEQVERLRSLAERTTTTLSFDPKGQSETNRTEYCVMKVLELEKEINADIDKLIDIKADIRNRIGRVESDKQRILLEQRYLCGKTWEQIADNMEVEPRTVYRIHGYALREVSLFVM